MKRNLIASLGIGFLLLFSGCHRRPSQIILRDFGNGLIYEQLVDVNNGTHVITKMQSDRSSGDIIIPGDVLWCEFKGNVIYGQKRAQEKPAAWMDDRWGKDGYFLLNPSKLRMNAATDDERFAYAIQWFNTKAELEKIIETIPD